MMEVPSIRTIMHNLACVALIVFGVLFALACGITLLYYVWVALSFLNNIFLQVMVMFLGGIVLSLIIALLFEPKKPVAAPSPAEGKPNV